MHFFRSQRLLLYTYLGCVLLLLTACAHERVSYFVELSPDDTHVAFVNAIEETNDLNIFTYEYMYNGGGVAAGDLNNDGNIDLVFTGNMVSNKVYLNRGHWKFEDITKTAGLEGRKNWKTGVALADVNSDGRLDVYICYSGPGSDEDRCNELYINQGGDNPVFTEQAAAYGLDACGTFSTQASFFDYDRDGDLDMFLLNHARLTYNPFYNSKKLRALRHPQYGNRLFRNDGGIYKDISALAGIHGSGINFGLGVSASDINNDGWPDLYVTNDYEEQDFLYLNNGDGTFKETLQKSFKHISRNGMGCDVSDFNNDGRADVMVVDMMPEDNYRQKVLKGADDYDRYNLLRDSGYHHQNMRNVLQLNIGIDDVGIPLFSEVGQLSGVSNTDWSWSPLFADFDNDGLKDLFISNGFLRDFTNLDFVKYNYEQSRKEKVNKSGAEDIVKKLPATKIQNYIFQNNGDLTFIDKTEIWGLAKKNITNGATYADLDNDGDLDIITNNINESASLLENRIAKDSNHFVKLRLIGMPGNHFGVGSKVSVTTGAGTQVQELYSTRGFQSSVPTELVFGIGANENVIELKVLWPDGNLTTVTNAKSDTTLTINYNSAKAETANTARHDAWFENIDHTGVSFVHKENDFIDYKVQYILPYQLSKYGPCLTAADVNNDGEDDFYLGGASGQSGKLYISGKNGFSVNSSQPWNMDSLCEDTGALFFDADNDGDDDLYVVSGGAEVPPSMALLMQDRLYTNDGKGKFTKAIDALPTDISNGSCVTAGDFDKDGDLDLFVGGRSVPGNFPMVSPSLLLRNDTKDGVVKFSHVKPADLVKPGIVTTALWNDYNHDTWPDLILAGEYMPITFFENQQGTFVNKTNELGLGQSNGLWCKLLAADINHDGHDDIIAGNAGTNLPFKASSNEPFRIYAGDFDQNGRIDPIETYYIQGTEYPSASRDELLEQMPPMRRKFITYESYGKATISEILNEQQRSESATLLVNTTESCLFINHNGKSFETRKLPKEAQFSMVSCIEYNDYNNDGVRDILLAGNFYPYRVQWGRSDASSGLILQGTQSGDFIPRLYDHTRLNASGDIRSVVSLKTKRGDILLFGRNDDAPLFIKPNFKSNDRTIQ